MLGPMLASEHNLQFLHNLLKDIQQSIDGNHFKSFKKDYLQKYNSSSSTGKAG
jgi:queuine tRNA-ribosyltransferase